MNPRRRLPQLYPHLSQFSRVLFTAISMGFSILASSAAANAAPLVLFSTPDEGSYITTANYEAFQMTGFCSESGRQVTITGPASVNASCIDNAWAAIVDVSFVFDGNLTFTADHISSTGAKAPSVHRSFTKDTIPPFGNRIVINDGVTPTPSTSVVINASSQGASSMYLTNTAGCTSGGRWGAYQEQTPWIISPIGNTATVYARFADEAGNLSSCVKASIQVELPPATLAITSPDEGSLVLPTNVSAFVLSGTCSDSTLPVQISGAAAGSTSCANGAWSATLNLSAAPEGNITLTATQTRTSGVAVTASRSFFKDTQPALVAITAPAAGTFITSANQSAFEVSGTCSENSRIVALSGAVSASPFCTNGLWSAKLNLSTIPDGPITVHADHTDSSGLAAVRSTRTFEKDTTAPAVAITSPAQGSFVNLSNRNAFAVSGTCTEEAGTVMLSGSVTGTATCSAGAWSSTLVLGALPDGLITLNADLADSAGNTAPRSTRTFVKDTIAPTVAITAPAEGTLISAAAQATFSVSGSCSESTRSVTLSGSIPATVTCVNGSWSAVLNLTSIADGTVTVHADHTDAAGNTATRSTRTFLKDTVAPTVAITSPAAGFVINIQSASSFPVSGTCSENTRAVTLSGAVSTSVTCTGGIWSVTLNLSNVSDGTIVVNADHQDAAGNPAPRATRSFLKDTVAPTVAITAPAEGTLIGLAGVAAFTVSGTCSESTRNVLLSGSVVGTALCSSGTWSSQLNLSSAADGTITVHADHSDAAGNGATRSTRTFVKDTAVPTVAITAPAAGALISAAMQGAFTVSGTCSENTRSVLLSGSTTGSVTCSEGSWSATLNLTSVADGVITIHADHSDAAGNGATRSTRTFVKDTLAPTVAITTPAAGTIIGLANAGAFAVSGTCSENTRTVTLSGSVSSSVNCSDGKWSVVLNLTAVADGTITVHADHSDAAGNTALRSTRTFLKDTLVPLVAFTAPEAGSFVNLANQSAFSIKGTCSENTQPVRISGTATAITLCVNGIWAVNLDLSSAADGTVTVQADHSDAAGNTAPPAIRSFVKDAVAPTVTLIAPSPALFVNLSNQGAFTINGTCSENTRTVTLSGAVNSTAVCTEGTWTMILDLTKAPDGWVTLHADHQDAAGNPALRDTKVFVKDTAAPAVAINSPAEGSFVSLLNQAAFTVSGTCSGTAGTVALSGAVVVDVACTDGAWTTILNLSEHAEGSILILADAKDIAGNSAPQASRTFVKDTVIPTVAFSTPAEGALVIPSNQAAYPLSGTCSEYDRGVRISGTGVTPVITLCTQGLWAATVDLSQTAEGAITIYANHSDSAWNEAIPAMRNLVKDTVIPTVAFTSPAIDAYVNSLNLAAFPISGSCSEESRDVVISGAVTGTAVCTEGTWSITANFSTSSDGKVTVNADHADAAGNIAIRATRSFIKDTVAPVGTIVIAGGAKYTTAADVTLTLASAGAAEMYVTNTENCVSGGMVSGGSWEPYSTNRTWTLGTLNSISSVYVAYRDVAGNVGTCAKDDIIHDNTPPAPPVFVQTDPVSPAPITTPAVIGTAASQDTAQVQLHLSSTCGDEAAASATKEIFQNEGITVTVPADQTTSIYGRTVDFAGNSSECVLLTAYQHRSLTLTISPQMVDLPSQFAHTIPFTADGGDGDYRFTITSGNGTIDSKSGAYKVSVGANGTTLIQVKDGTGAVATATIHHTRAHELAFDGTVHAIAVDADRNRYYGGSFKGISLQTTGGGTLPERIETGSLVKVRADGRVDFDFIKAARVNAPVYAIAISSRTIYFGGDFTRVGKDEANRLAKVDQDGNLDMVFNPKKGANGVDRTVHALVVRDETLYAGGTFRKYRGADATYFVKVNSAGIQDTNFTSKDGPGGAIYALALAPQGEVIYVGGKFSKYRTAKAHNIARVFTDSGEPDLVFSPQANQLPSGTNNEVTALATDALGNVYIGGRFNRYGGEFSRKVMRLTPEGVVDPTFLARPLGSGNASARGSVHAIVVDSVNERIYVGGLMETINGQRVNNIAALSPTGEVNPVFSPQEAPAGTDAPYNHTVPVLAIALDGEEILIGGAFSRYRDERASNLAIVNQDGARQ